MTLPHFTSDQVTAAAVLVENMLRAGEFHYNPDPTLLFGVSKSPVDRKVFCMSYSMNPAVCGTVGCAGGWIGHYLGLNREEIYEFVWYHTYLAELVGYELANSLRQLFWPHGAGPQGMGSITPQETADAIQRWRNGEHPWPLGWRDLRRNDAPAEAAV